MNAQRFLDEITVGFLEYRAAQDLQADGGPQFLVFYRAADALARVAAAGLAVERAAYAVLLDLADAPDEAALVPIEERRKDLLEALGGPLEVLVAQINRGTAPDDSRRQHALYELEHHRREAVGALQEVGRNLERIKAKQI